MGDNIFKSNMLENLYTIRRDNLENFIVNQYQKTKIPQKTDKVRTNLENSINKVIKDEENRKLILDKIEEFHECTLEQMSFWNEHCYKSGLIDGTKLVGEIREKIEILEK